MCAERRRGFPLKLAGTRVQRSLRMRPEEERAMVFSVLTTCSVPSGSLVWETIWTVAVKGASGMGAVSYTHLPLRVRLRAMSSMSRSCRRSRMRSASWEMCIRDRVCGVVK